MRLPGRDSHLGLAIFSAALVAGWWVARPLVTAAPALRDRGAPRREARGEVRVARSRRSCGSGLRLEGQRVEVWPGAAAPACGSSAWRPRSASSPTSRACRACAGLRWRGRGCGPRARPRALDPSAVARSREALQARSRDLVLRGRVLRPLIALEGLARSMLTKTWRPTRWRYKTARSGCRRAAARRGSGDRGHPGPRAAASPASVTRGLRCKGGCAMSGRARRASRRSGSRSRSGELRLALAATHELDSPALLPARATSRGTTQRQGQRCGDLRGTLARRRASRGRPRGPRHAQRRTSLRAVELGPLEASRVELAGELAIDPGRSGSTARVSRRTPSTWRSTRSWSAPSAQLAGADRAHDPGRDARRGARRDRLAPRDPPRGGGGHRGASRGRAPSAAADRRRRQLLRLAGFSRRPHP